MITLRGTEKLSHRSVSSPFCPSRENFVPHTKPIPVQNSPCSADPPAHPVQNSPNTHKKAYFSPFCPSRENFVPHPEPIPVQNSPCSAGPGAHPVQNSPRTPKKANFSPFYPSRENFVPPPPPRSRAGRTFYRTQQHLRYKTLPAPPFYSGSAKKFAQHT